MVVEQIIEVKEEVDMQYRNRKASTMWVGKVKTNTRVLVVTAENHITAETQGFVKELDHLSSDNYLELIKIPFPVLVPYLEQITDEEARPYIEKLVKNLDVSNVSDDLYLNDIKYYLAVKKMMEVYKCRVYVTACQELSISGLPQKYNFNPCVCHKLMKQEGLQNGCDEDFNALLMLPIQCYYPYDIMQIS